MSKTITGTLIKRKDGYYAFIRANGEQHKCPLETDDYATAEKRRPDYVRKFLVNLGKRPTKKHHVAVVSIDMSEVAEKCYATRKEMGNASWKDEEAWWRLHAKPILGSHLPRSITSSDVEEVLVRAKAKGLSGKSLRHIYYEIDRVLDAAKKQLKIAISPDVMGNVDMPKVSRKKKDRTTLTDEEFSKYVAHPDTLMYSLVDNVQRKIGGQVEIVSREIKTLAILARIVGGARASDLHALTWEHVDTVNWQTITIPRPKVSSEDEAKEDRYFIPEAIIAYLDQWHRDHGQPTVGPVFPSKRRLGGYNAARRKVARSYASDLRRDLLAAGIDRHEVHNDTTKSRRTDFHSLRRAYVGALHRAGISIRESMDLTSHVSQQVHRRYDVETRAPMLTPAGIIPALAPVPARVSVVTEPVQYDTILQTIPTIPQENSTIEHSPAESIQLKPYDSTTAGNDTSADSLAPTSTYLAEQIHGAAVGPGQRTAVAAKTKEGSGAARHALYISPPQT